MTDSLIDHTGRSVAIDKAVERLGVSKRTIYNWIREGKLQTMRTLGGSQRVLVESIDALMISRRHKP